jgi:hypothetical protein
MKRALPLLALVALFLAATAAGAADPAPPVLTAVGTVDKVDKDSLTVRPRRPDGKFDKSVVLKVTGTSKISTVTAQTRAKKLVMVQKDTDANELKPGQQVAVIYAALKDGNVLLAAVAQPAEGK